MRVLVPRVGGMASRKTERKLVSGNTSEWDEECGEEDMEGYGETIT